MGLYIYTFFVCVWYAGLCVVASPAAEHRLWTRRPSGHGLWAQPLRGMRDPPGPGHEPVSPASAGGLSTTAPPGKPITTSFSKPIEHTKPRRNLNVNHGFGIMCQ